MSVDYSSLVVSTLGNWSFPHRELAFPPRETGVSYGRNCGALRSRILELLLFYFFEYGIGLQYIIIVVLFRTMNGKLIESPKSFQVACTIVTQIIASVASSQYGGQSDKRILCDCRKIWLYDYFIYNLFPNGMAGVGIF